MYDHPSWLIVALLFAALVVATELGYRIGMRNQAATGDGAKTQINTIQASLLGVLALLLGFTFSLSLQRYDSRAQAVVHEANAIGTAMLRADLVPASVRSEAQAAMVRYLDQRIAAGNISLDRVEERASAVAAANATFDRLWQLGAEAAEAEPNPVRTGLFLQALNDMIDAFGIRDAALNRHVPELVLFLLFGTFVLTVSLVGYSSGLSGQRASYATYVLMILIVFLVFIIIDMDRPRRGVIEVSQQSLVDLSDSPLATRYRATD